MLTAEQKKKWTSLAIKECEKVSQEKNIFKDFYAGPATMTTDELLDMVEKFSRSYMGKLDVDIKIKEKVRKGQKLDQGNIESTTGQELSDTSKNESWIIYLVTRNSS